MKKKKEKEKGKMKKKKERKFMLHIWYPWKKAIVVYKKGLSPMDINLFCMHLRIHSHANLFSVGASLSKITNHAYVSKLVNRYLP